MNNSEAFREVKSLPQGALIQRVVVYGCFARVMVECANAARAGHADMATDARRDALEIVTVAGLRNAYMEPLLEMAVSADHAAPETEPALVTQQAKDLAELVVMLRGHCIMASGLERGETEMERVSMALGQTECSFLPATEGAALH